MDPQLDPLIAACNLSNAQNRNALLHTSQPSGELCLDLDFFLQGIRIYIVQWSDIAPDPGWIRVK